MRKLFLGLLSLAVLFLSAQEPRVLTLEECLEFATQNNIALKRAKNNELIADVNKLQAILNFLPTLNAGINYDYYFGTFFDTNAARQVTETTNSSNPNLSSQLILFNGLANQHGLKQSIEEQRSATAGVRNAELGVRVNILNSFLNVVLGKENLKISKDRLNLLQNQHDREEKRVSVGVGSLDAVYNLRSQLSNEKLNFINLKNAVSSSLLTLIQAMQLDPKDNYDVETFEIDEIDLLLDVDKFDVLLAESRSSSPSLEQADANRKASKYALKGSSAQKLPTLSVFGRIGSGYSSNGATNPSRPFFNPEDSAAGFNFEPNATFFEQLDYNGFKYINFSLSIPIFNRYQASRDVQLSKIGVLNSDLAYKEAENTITNIVQQAYLDMLNAQTTYSSAEENLKAQNATFEFIKKRFETGNTDFYSYLESLNNKNRAEAQLVNAKYTIVLRKRILDLYRGK
jgi:outer membrane protein